jgi:hypothetical protein
MTQLDREMRVSALAVAHRQQPATIDTYGCGRPRRAAAAPPKSVRRKKPAATNYPLFSGGNGLIGMAFVADQHNGNGRNPPLALTLQQSCAKVCQR